MKILLNYLLSKKFLLFIYLGCYTATIFINIPLQAQTKKAIKMTPISKRIKVESNTEILLNPKRIVLEQRLEERARKILGDARIGEYLLNVNVDLNIAKIEKTYLKTLKGSSNKESFSSELLPEEMNNKDLMNSSIKDLTVDELFSFIKKISVKLTIDKRVPEGKKIALEKGLKDALKMQDNRDNFVINKDDMVSEQVKTQLEEKQREAEEAKRRQTELETRLKNVESFDKSAMQAKIQSLETQLTEANRSRDQLNRELDLAKNNKLSSKYKTDLESKTAHEAELVEKQAKIGDKQLNLDYNIINYYLKIFNYFLAALPLCIILYLVARGLIGVKKQQAKNSLDGLNALAQAVTQLSRKSITGQTLDTTVNKISEGENKNHSAHSIESVEYMNKEVIILWDLLQKEFNTMLLILKDLLTDSENRERFVYFSEAIGAQQARLLWSKFPREELETLTPFLLQPISKMQAYSSVGLVYRMVTKEITSKPAFFNRLDLEVLVHTTDQELALALDQSPIEAVGFCLLLISPSRSKRLLNLLKNHQKTDIILALNTTKNTDEATAKDHLQQIKEAKPENNQAKGFDVTNHFLYLMDSSDAQLKLAINKVLAEDSELHIRLKEKTFTFEDVLRLDDDSLSEIITRLDLKEVAALLTTLPPAAINRISSYYNGNMRTALQLEFQKINKKPLLKRKAQQQGLQLQNSLSKQIKTEVERGSLFIDNKAA